MSYFKLCAGRAPRAATGFFRTAFFGATLFRAALPLALTMVLPAAAFAVPSWDAPEKVSQGHAFVVTGKDAAPFSVEVEWRGKKIPVTARPTKEVGRWEAKVMLGVPIDEVKKQPLTLRVTDHEGKKSSRALTVTPVKVKWIEQQLSVEPKFVTPPADAQEQIKKDRAHTGAVLAALSPFSTWTLPFQRPVKGTVSNSFAGRRVFNGQPRSPHTGTDLRGPTGTPILAVADGVVALAEAQYYSGNAIFIDHGQGVVSMYGHMSAFAVKKGDKVKRGQVIGKVGATGRVTGPHLHSSLFVQGVAVDIMPLFENRLEVVGGPTPEVKRLPQPEPAKAAPAKKAAAPAKASAAKKAVPAKKSADAAKK